jgi:hypothetical protein
MSLKTFANSITRRVHWARMEGNVTQLLMALTAANCFVVGGVIGDDVWLRRRTADVNFIGAVRSLVTLVQLSETYTLVDKHLTFDVMILFFIHIPTVV